MRLRTLAAGLVVCGVALTACSNSGDTTAADQPTASPTAKPSTARPTPKRPKLNLSARWIPKINDLDSRNSTPCTPDPGSEGCLSGLLLDANLGTDLLKDIQAAHGEATYPTTISWIRKEQDAFRTYKNRRTKFGCAGTNVLSGPAAQCFRAATLVTSDMVFFKDAMQIDEVKQP